MRLRKILIGVAVSLFSLLGTNAQPSGYCVPEGIYNVTTKSERYIKTVTISGATFKEEPVEFTKDISPAGNRTNVYYDKTAEELTVTAGDVLNISWTRSSALIWMHFYAYIDYNQDGVFDQNTEAVAYTYYKGKDSKGVAAYDGGEITYMPNFTIPESALKGATRLRIKCDWDCLNPCENDEEKNYIYKNGGSIIDFTINIVAKANPVVTIVQPENGNIIVTDTEGNTIENETSVEPGTKLVIATTANEGMHLKHLLINGEPSQEHEITVYKDLAISAMFTADWNLQYFVSDGAKLSVTRKSDGTTIDTNADLAPGTEVDMALSFEEGYELVSATLNGEDAKALFTEENQYKTTLTMTANQNLSIVVAKKRLEVSLKQIGTWGLLSIEGYNGAADSESILIEYGTEITIKAVPEECDEAWLESFTINGKDRTNDLTAAPEYSLNMTVKEPLEIIATFAVHMYSVKFNITGKGKVILFDSVTKEEYPLGEKYPQNAQLSCRLTPEDDNWELSSIKENGDNVDLNSVVGGIYEIGWLMQDYVYDVVFTTSGVGIKDEAARSISLYYHEDVLYVNNASPETVCTFFDLTGKPVMTGTGNVVKVSQLTAGCYLVKVTTDKDVKVLKFVKE